MMVLWSDVFGTGARGLEVGEGVGQARVQRVGHQPRQRRAQQRQHAEQRRRQPRLVLRLETQASVSRLG